MRPTVGDNSVGYLSELVLGNYPEKSEDRLTQTFAATYNHSARFRKCFWRFIGRDPLAASSSRAVTQQAHSINGNKARLDIVIVNSSDTPVLLIENKIEAPLYAEQLKRYGALPGFRRLPKFALVKNYFDLLVPLGWRVLHWSELHGTIRDQSDGWRDDSDAFVIKSFLRRLEDMRMARVSVIEAQRLRGLAKAVQVIRSEKKSEFSLAKTNVFETAADYMSMLEELIDLVRCDPELSRRFGKTVRFSPWISWYWRDDGKQDLWLGCYIRLSKKRNGIREIGTGIWFDSKNGRHGIESWVKKVGWEQIDHRGPRLTLDTYADEAIRFWKKKLS